MCSATQKWYLHIRRFPPFFHRQNTSVSLKTHVTAWKTVSSHFGDISHVLLCSSVSLYSCLLRSYKQTPSRTSSISQSISSLPTIEARGIIHKNKKRGKWCCLGGHTYPHSTTHTKRPLLGSEKNIWQIAECVWPKYICYWLWTSDGPSTCWSSKPLTNRIYGKSC